MDVCAVRRVCTKTEKRLMSDAHIAADALSAIQETVDIHRTQMPTGVTTTLMEQCQKAYQALPNLYKVHYHQVDAVAKGKVDLTPCVQIVEEETTEKVPWPVTWHWVLGTGLIPPKDSQHLIKGGMIASDGEGRVRIITKVVPFLKRARGTED